MSPHCCISHLLTEGAVPLIVPDDASGHGPLSLRMRRPPTWNKDVKDERWGSTVPQQTLHGAFALNVRKMRETREPRVHEGLHTPSSIERVRIPSELPMKKPLRRSSIETSECPPILRKSEDFTSDLSFHDSTMLLIEKMDKSSLSSPPVKLAEIDSFKESAPYKPSRSPCA
jgi:hypothetical protein